MTSNAWRLPANADLKSARLVDGVLLFETDDRAPYRLTAPCTAPEACRHTLIVEPVKGSVTLDSRPLSNLTVQGYRLLLEFARQPDAYLSAKVLYEAVWLASYDSVRTRAVTFAAYRLRKHLPPGWLTHRPGYGYILLPRI